MSAAPLVPLLLAVLAAAAAPAAEPVSVKLELDAGPDCTTREEFMARVRARSDRIQFDEQARTVVRASLWAFPGLRSVQGELSVEQPDGTQARRQILTRTCERATDALALVLVLALDPTAAAPRPAPPQVQAAPPAPPPVVTAPPPPPAPPRARTGWALEAGARVLAGPAPHPMPGVAMAGRLTRDRPSVWSPALVLSLLHAWSGDLAEPGGTAAFTLNAVILDACPARLAARELEARACLSGLFGRLAASGSNTYEPASARRPFVATGASLLLGIALPWRLQLGGRLEADPSWRRDAFAFSPAVFHRAAPVTLGAGLSLGVRFR